MPPAIGGIQTPGGHRGGGPVKHSGLRMRHGTAALWGMKALVRKDTVAAGQISEPAVTDQRDLGNIHLYKKASVLHIKRQPREYEAQHGCGKTTVQYLC